MKTAKTTPLGNKQSDQTSTVKRYERALSRLTSLLKQRFWTARAIAKRTKCSKKIAYRRLEELRARGLPLAECAVRERRSGPLARAFKAL